MIKVLNLANDRVYFLGTLPNYWSFRILGSNYSENESYVDISIFGKGGAAPTCRGKSDGVVLYSKGRDIYIRVPTGNSVVFIVLGTQPTTASLPSDAVTMTVTPYQ